MALPGSPHEGTIGSAQLPGNNQDVAPDRAAGVREDAQPAAVHRNIRKELFMRRMCMEDKTCKTCIDNEDGFCDRKGILVEDDDQCTDHKPDWRESMMCNFLRGHQYG